MIKYTLFENAIDSITDGIDHLRDATQTKDKKKYKHALLDLFQGTELLLKGVLVQVNPILIFDKNSLYRNCKDMLNPKLEELYNCKSIDINEICKELKNTYKSNFDNHSINVILEASKERNKIQHFAIEISPDRLKEILVRLYGKVIKPSIGILNYNSSPNISVLGESFEKIFCFTENANREDAMLRIDDEDFVRGCCHNCNNYSMFIFYDKNSYPNRFYCTSCPHEKSVINNSDFHTCPECGTDSLIYDDNLCGGVCLWHKCANHKDGGILVDMEPCDKCNNYVIEGCCECESKFQEQ